MEIKHTKVVNLIQHLRESSDVIYRIFTTGSCFKLYQILDQAFEGCIALWSDTDSHCIIQIDNRFYDIGGEVKEKYVKDKGYFRIPEDQLSGYSLLKITRLDFNDNDNRRITVEKYK